MLKCIWTFDKILLDLGSMSAADEQAARMAYYRGWIIGTDENYNFMCFDPANRINIIRESKGETVMNEENKPQKPAEPGDGQAPAEPEKMDPEPAPADPGNGQDGTPPDPETPEPAPEQDPGQKPEEKTDTGSGKT